MDEILKKLEEQNARIIEIQIVVARIYKIFKWTMIGSIVVFVLPLIAILFILPYYLNVLTAGISWF